MTNDSHLETSALVSGRRAPTKSRRRYLKMIIIAAIALVIAVSVVIIWRRQQPSEVYTFAKVERGRLTQTVTATGKIESLNELKLSFEQTGVLSRLHRARGEAVKQVAVTVC